MCTYKQACDNAQKMFARNGYLNRVIGACDLPDKWLFFGWVSEDGAIEFGNRPISVDKETGILSWFDPFSGVGIDEYDAAVPSKLVFFSCRSCGKSLQCRYKEI